MRKLIAAINMTLDGYCDHTDMVADAELHDHYTEMLRHAGILLYGRITYQLMADFWPTLVKNPSGTRDLDDFAIAIDQVPKIVFSTTLQQVDWHSATLKSGGLREVVEQLKQQPGKDIYAGSPSMIVALTNLGLIDEYHLCVHPVIAGKGLPLFNHINDRQRLKLVSTKTFGSGAVVLYYDARTLN